MRTRPYTCGLDAAVDIIEGKWKPMIIWSLHDLGPTRFGELRRQVHGVTEKVLTQQLRELEADGVIHREVHAESPPRVVYSLTELGTALNTALVPLGDWGELHILPRNPAAPAPSPQGAEQRSGPPTRPAPA